MVISGGVLFIAPSGQIARETGWTFWGLARGAWGDLHAALGVLFIVGIVGHVVGHLRGLVQAMLGRRKGWRGLHEVGLALGLVGVVVVSSVLGVFPSDLVEEVEEFFKQDFWRP